MIQSRAVTALATVLIAALTACGSQSTTSAGTAHDKTAIVDGHHWRLISYKHAGTTIRLPAGERTLLSFDGRGHLTGSGPAGRISGHYSDTPSGYRVGTVNISSLTVLPDPYRSVERIVNDLTSGSITATPIGPRTIVLAGRRYRVTCVRTDGQPISPPPHTGTPSPARTR